MRTLFLALISIWLLSVTLIAQDGSVRCPNISVTGPPGPVVPGDIATYRVQVENSSNFQLQYRWSVSHGTIVSGQGKATVDIRQPNELVTVTVDMDGLPAGCPKTASETMIFDPGPQIVSLGVFRPSDGEFGRTRIQRISTSVTESPGAQLYILSGHVGGKASAKTIAKENEIIGLLEAAGLDRSQIALVGVNSDAEYIQFWLVPPGATPPRCRECEELEKRAADESHQPIRDPDFFTYERNISLKEESLRWNMLAKHLAQRDAVLHIIIRYWPGATPKLIKNNERQIYQYFQTHWPAVADRVKVITGPTDENSSITYRLAIPVSYGPYKALDKT